MMWRFRRWLAVRYFQFGGTKEDRQRPNDEPLPSILDPLTRIVAKSEAFAFDDRRDWRGELAPAIEAAETALTLNPNRPSIYWVARKALCEGGTSRAHKCSCGTSHSPQPT